MQHREMRAAANQHVDDSDSSYVHICPQSEALTAERDKLQVEKVALIDTIKSLNRRCDACTARDMFSQGAQHNITVGQGVAGTNVVFRPSVVLSCAEE